MSKKSHFSLLWVVLILTTAASFGAHVNTHPLAPGKPKKPVESAHARKKMGRMAHSRPTVGSRAAHTASYTQSRRHRYYERFSTSSFADDITDGDVTLGEDPVVRQAAVEALGGMNGTVVAIDPSSGRVLAMVNQKLALSSGAQPCSTIKLSVAMAALSEGIIDKDTPVALGRTYHMNLTDALAHSNNAYFEAVGRQLGFDRVSYYARQYGLGELAGLNIKGERAGSYPDEEIPAAQGGVGKMCSFGEGVSMTALQLGAIVAAIANGGTLYYLQHPTTTEQVIAFQPRVKRHLDIGPIIPQLSEGMAGAVDYGTARSLHSNFTQETILGKTGTCSRAGTRYGWFASYANSEVGRIVTVIFLQGGRPTFGPKAAELAGLFYRSLYDHNYFASALGPATSQAAVEAAGAGH
jgi:cell division protein FtsI/penicillin-binding protein 2